MTGPTGQFGLLVDALNFEICTFYDYRIEIGLSVPWFNLLKIKVHFEESLEVG